MKAVNVKTKRDDERWEIEVSAEIPAEALAEYREQELKELQKEAKLDGFRPGHAPIERIIDRYGEPSIMRGVAERAIQEELPEILAKENLPVVETPRVSTDDPIRQLADGKPLSFTARAGLAPEVKLADWKAIAKKHNETKESVTVSDEEHKDALTHIRRERVRIDKIEQGEEPAKAAEQSRALAETELPELDNEFLKSIGYENMEAFEEAMRTGLKNEKESRAREANRTAILEDILKGSTVRYPAIMREYELDDMESRLSEDLARMGASFEQYLADVKKTRDEVRTEWAPAAEKRAKIRLILAEIAKEEKIIADQEAIEHELEHAKQHYQGVDENNLRAGIAHALRNEKVMELLEKQ